MIFSGNSTSRESTSQLHLPPPSRFLRLAITGHRDLLPDCIAQVREALAFAISKCARLVAEDAHGLDPLQWSSVELTLISALAEGADQLAVEVFRETSFPEGVKPRFEAVLPFDINSYATTMSPSAAAQMRRLGELADSRFVLADGGLDNLPDEPGNAEYEKRERDEKRWSSSDTPSSAIFWCVRRTFYSPSGTGALPVGPAARLRSWRTRCARAFRSSGSMRRRRGPNWCNVSGRSMTIWRPAPRWRSGSTARRACPNCAPFSRRRSRPKCRMQRTNTTRIPTRGRAPHSIRFSTRTCPSRRRRAHRSTNGSCGRPARTSRRTTIRSGRRPAPGRADAGIRAGMRACRQGHALR